jgi:hypothetical protein
MIDGPFLAEIPRDIPNFEHAFPACCCAACDNGA